ncbi:unknown [Clostridium sp. CAG:568]|nr:unknown [Clostridium sp. CAG:568]
MELEKVHKELYPFREWNLPRVEDGSGKRIELPAACLAFPDCKACLLVEPVSSDFLRSTERAFLDDDGIYEIHFFFRWLPMFGIIPFRDGRDHQVSRHKSIGKFAPEGFFLSFVHVWRFRPLASVFPKPPSLKKDNARQKALSIKLRHSLVWRQYYTNYDL